MISAVIEFEDGKIATHTSKTKSVSEKFKPGFFEAFYTPEGKLQISSKELIEIHNPYDSKENSLILKTVESFFCDGIKEKVEKMGFIHKLGILMHGKQGTGKTSIMNSISKYMIENRDSIVIFCNNFSTLNGGIGLAKEIRNIQDNPIIFIADEFDIYVHELESDLKNLLDGKDSIPNSLFLASTNYIEKIPNTLKERPSRFKISIEIKGINNKKIMFDILKGMSNKLDDPLFLDDEIIDVFKEVDDITIDEIKQLALDKLTNTYIPKNIKPTIGFKANNKEEELEEKIIDKRIYSVYSDSEHLLSKTKSVGKKTSNSNI